MERRTPKIETIEDPNRRPLKVQDLMRHGPVLELDHDGQIYRLRITRNQKLILTK